MRKFFQTLYSDGGHYRGVLSVFLSIVALFSPYLLAILGFNFPKYNEVVKKIVVMPYGWLCLPLLVWIFFAYLKRYEEYKNITNPTKRIPLQQTLLEAEKLGWNLDGEEIEDLTDALKQSGMDGDFSFWGRPTSTDILENFSNAHSQPLRRIDDEFLGGSFIVLGSTADRMYGGRDRWRQDNLCINLDGRTARFADLHISYIDINKWLKNTADQYKGRRKKLADQA